ncbi:glycosyl transferase family 2 [Rhodanobacter thiooxydans]|uniref:Glycosyl transferase family 2 n=2 Tax=Rhodanobacter thiooxydans TaxID=416169 RepID=A0A154QDI3_9GAMM|nr:family 2 glycosyl transferase [Rhodanobacter thiooxydans LCS2]KZC22033.1 glycosyl transferase family 2 [Rhodanobacter thiooxydans]
MVQLAEVNVAWRSPLSPSISVVIPAYNANKFIVRALASIESQTLTPDEVIVVDDGSTDHTALQVAEFARHSKLALVLERQPNRGSSAARNHGIRRAAGELITFLDADDLIYPGFLECTVSGLTRFPNWAACFSDRDVVDADGKFISHDLDHPMFRQIVKKVMGGSFFELEDGDLFSHMIAGSVIPMTITCRKSRIDEVGGFDETLLFNEDRLFFLQLIKKKGKLGYFNESLGVWQRHAANKTSASNAINAIKYSDVILQKLMADKDSLDLSPAEIDGVQAAQRRLATQWIYAASRARSRSTIALGRRFLVERRITMGCFLKAIGRYLISSPKS